MNELELLAIQVGLFLFLISVAFTVDWRCFVQAGDDGARCSPFAASAVIVFFCARLLHLIGVFDLVPFCKC